MKQIKQKFLEKLKESGWNGFMREFVESDKFDKLYKNLIKAKKTTGITPDLNMIFNAFYKCPYDKLVIVILGQDSYPQNNVADGMAFSCSRTMKEQPSLKYIFNELAKNRMEYSYDPDLSRWAEQGMLLLNCALSTVPGKIGVHYGIWKDFIDFLLNKLKEEKPGLVYIYMGKEAQMRKVNDKLSHHLFCPHPASAIYSKTGIWDSKGVFERASGLVKNLNNIKIEW